MYRFASATFDESKSFAFLDESLASLVWVRTGKKKKDVTYVILGEVEGSRL